jgi:S1-C subfamily serine protease
LNVGHVEGVLRPGIDKRFASEAVRRRLPNVSGLLIVVLCTAFCISGSAQAQFLDRGSVPVDRNGPPAPDVAANPVSVVEHVTHQVYRLLVDVEGAIKGGTAFLVSGSRVIATNHHVIEKGTAFSVGYAGEKGVIKRIPLRVLAVFPQKDLALLEALDDLPGQALPLSTQYPGSGADLFAIGFPAAADPQGALSWTRGEDETFFIPSVLKGYVSRVLTNRWFSSQLQHQTPIIPGYSGGPLIDNNGTVVGISTSIHKEANGISYAVLAADLADFVAACALPLRGGIVPERPTVRRNSAARAPEAVNTYSIQNKSPPAPEDKAMLARGLKLLAGGDIVAARLMFRYLANNRGLAEAFAGLAKTYDPIYLNKQNVLGVSGDAVKAEEFYRQAAKLGATELDSLSVTAAQPPEGRCDDSVCKLVNSARGPFVVCERSEPDVKSARR